MTSASSQTRPGKFGRYRLLGPLASGGMAVVYRAVLDGPSGFARPMAIKRIRPDLASEADFRAMLLDEALLSARLHHPNIVQVVECGEVEQELYIAMELIEGCDLRAIITRARELKRQIPPAVCAFLGAGLASALAYAHDVEGEKGKLRLVHRDVSPTNVMVTQQGAVKLLDFGIAKATVMLRDDETRTGVVKGKFAYMSPEQAGGLDLDSRSDLFSLGAVLYEALTLTPPFRGANDLATLRLVREAKVAPVTSLVPGLSPRWQVVFDKLLQANPELRFGSGLELERELLALAGAQGNPAATREFVASLGLGERSDSGQPATQSAVLAATPLESPTTDLRIDTELPPSPSRRPALIAAGLVLGLAVAGTIAFSRRAPSESASPAPAPAAVTVEPAASATPALVEPPPKPVAVTAPAKVMIDVRALKGAKVSLDGVAAGRAPVALEVASQPEPRKVRIERDGFLPFETTVPGNSGIVVEATLKPLPAKKAEKRPAHRQGDVSDPFR